MNWFLKSFRFAWNGIRTAFAEQRNFKFHVSAALAVVAAGFIFGISEGEWIAIVLVIGFVITAELFNSSVEYIVNLISPQNQPLAGKIKDLAAGAVLVAAITAAVVGCIVFGKYLFIALNFEH